jgi:hypothetical protein
LAAQAPRTTKTALKRMTSFILSFIFASRSAHLIWTKAKYAFILSLVWTKKKKNVSFYFYFIFFFVSFFSKNYFLFTWQVRSQQLSIEIMCKAFFATPSNDIITNNIIWIKFSFL